MMVDAIVSGMRPQPASALLDIGCGNGALTSRLFPYCSSCLGVDFSEYLITVAVARFGSKDHAFICRDLLDYVEQEPHPLRFDKVLCFAVVSYLSNASASRLLASLSHRFLNVDTVFIGNCPDRDCAAGFFENSDPATVELDNPESQIGVWRAKGEMAAMAERAGWLIRFQQMRPDFYQAHYRYNAILERPA